MCALESEWCHKQQSIDDNGDGREEYLEPFKMKWRIPVLRSAYCSVQNVVPRPEGWNCRLFCAIVFVHR